MIPTFELAVIGAGPAGMQAAITAAENNIKTAIVDSFPQPGGQYFMQLPQSYRAGKRTETEQSGHELLQKMNALFVTQYSGALTWGIFREDGQDEWLLGLYGQDAPKFIRARRLILAGGAYDTPVAFPGWTLPGVITCGAALIMTKTQRIAPGTRAVISGSGPLLLSAAAHLLEAGVQVLAICESNRLLPRGLAHATTMLSHWHRVKEGAKYMGTILKHGVPYKTGWSVRQALGENHVDAAILTRLDKNGQPLPGKQISVEVDLLVTGYSLTPNTGLARMIGCELEYRPGQGGWVPRRTEKMESSIAGVFIAGDGAGIGGAENAQLEGQIAALEAAVQSGHILPEIAQNRCRELLPRLRNQQRFGKLYADLFTPPAGLISLATDDTLLCRCEEVTLGEVKQAVQMGAKTIAEVKMITRSGMGNCQGRMCERSVAQAITAALADEFVSPASAGYYTVRPPLHPVPADYLADALPELE